MTLSGEEGIVFIRFLTPLSKLTQNIGKQVFDGIGPYYSTIINSKKEYRVILPVFNQMPSDFSLDDLLKHPIVEKVSYKELSPVLNDDGSTNQDKTKARQILFRTSLAKTKTIPLESYMTDIVYQNFGFKNDKTTVSQLSIEFVNKFMMTAGLFDSIPQKGTIYLGARVNTEITNLPLNLVGLSTCLGLLFTNARQNIVANPNHVNKTIQSYIEKSSVFNGALINVIVDKKDPSDYINSMKNTIYSNLREYMTQMIDLVFTNEQYMKDFISGFNTSLAYKETYNQNIKESATELVTKTGDLATKLNQAMCTGSIKYSELYQAMKDVNFSRVKLETAGLEMTPTSVQLNDLLMSRFIRISCDNGICDQFMTSQDMPSPTKSHLTEFKRCDCGRERCDCGRNLIDKVVVNVLNNASEIKDSEILKKVKIEIKELNVKDECLNKNTLTSLLDCVKQ